MRNPRPACPNEECRNHQDPPAGFYWKKGYYRHKHSSHQVPRYQCKACGTTFSSTQTSPIRGQHRPDLNRRIFELAVAGATMRRMELILGCSKRTIARKIAYLAGQAKAHHASFLSGLAKEGGTSYVMMDELETFIHARHKQVSVPVAIRVKTGQILALGVAKMRNDLAKLGRKTWTTTKSRKALENHLWLWVAWTNGYKIR